MGDQLIPDIPLGQALAAATGEAGWTRLSHSLISGGKSNLTYLLRSPAGELVLRRPPTGTLLPTAHDMLREARVQKALVGTSVPTARVILVDEGLLIGAPCYVMERVVGHVVRGRLPDGYADTFASRRSIGLRFVDTLAALHSIDFAAIGLASFGHPDGYLARQVNRWTQQWQASLTHPVPALDELARRLAGRVPVQQPATIVHGDYRLDNVILDPADTGRVSAVLDWELSTLGDPLTDLALLLLFWREDGDPELSLNPAVSQLPGFPSRQDLLDRYVMTSSADLTDLDWHIGFAHFKFAVITQGVAARSRSGAMAGQDFGDLDDEVPLLAERGLDHL